MSKLPQIYVVSDSLGETAESVAKATISQYDADIEIHRVPFVRHSDQIEKIVDDAAAQGASRTLLARRFKLPPPTT